MHIHITIVVLIDVISLILTLLSNAIFLITLLKSHSLHTPSNFLLGALCCCDFLVGIVVQPLFLTNMFSSHQCYPFNILAKVYYYTYILCCGFSLFLASLLSIDRYIAICHPYRYYTIVNINKYSVVIGIFLATLAASTSLIFIDIYHLWMGFFVIEVLVITVILVSYVKIYCVILNLKTTVPHTFGTFDGEKEAKLRKQRKEREKTFTIGVILGFLLASYFVEAGRSLDFLIKRQGNNCDTPTSTLILDMWTDVFVLANSCVNPIIYCVRSKEIRTAALRIFRPTSNNFSSSARVDPVPNSAQGPLELGMENIVTASSAMQISTQRINTPE